MVKQFQLGLEALAYIEACLAQGRDVSHYLLSLPLQKGQTVAFLPQATSDQAARAFTVGGIIPQEVASPFAGGTSVEIKGTETARVFSTLVQDFLSGENNRYAVFEHQLAKEGDLFLATSDVKFFTHGPLVCYFFGSNDRDHSLIMKARNLAASGQLFIGLLTSLPNEFPCLQDRQPIASDVLRLLGSRTEYILVGAYDNEGEIIWCRNPGVGTLAPRE